MHGEGADKARPLVAELLTLPACPRRKRTGDRDFVRCGMHEAGSVIVIGRAGRSGRGIDESKL